MHPYIGTPSDGFMMHLCGDNWDKRLKRRYIRLGVKKVDSLNYFHSYTYADRVDFSHLSSHVTPTLQSNADQIAISILPTVDDDVAIRSSICILIARVLYKNVRFFQTSFDGCIDWHIKHEFYEEMSKKSDIVSCN